jgi:LmbE family N-acetylglucosaminyl deacetylase
MKPTPTSPTESDLLLVFGAHPDDIEFGCGGIVAKETHLGRKVHFVVCSRGEAGSHGTPAERVVEAGRAAALLGATLEFLDLDGDAHLEIRVTHTLQIARLIRQHKPALILAPSLVENQHPDHSRLGRLVRDAARLARYGGLMELKDLAVHAVGQVLFYAVTPDAEPTDITPILVDISAPGILAAWTAAMEAHSSQVSARNYVELQITRARFNGLRCGIHHAIPLFPNDPIRIDSLAALKPGTRRF